MVSVNMLRVLAVSFLIAGGTLPCRSALISFTASEVTGIMESYPSNNLGAMEWFPCGATQNFNCGTTNAPLPCENRGLIRFDPAQWLPSGSVIKQVIFNVATTLQPPADEGEPSQDFDIHRMMVPWGEGTGQNQPGKFPGEVGRPAEPGESSWFMRQAPTNSWGIPGGASGVDYATQPSGSVFIPDDLSASPFPFLSISNRMEADFQLWLDQPEQNHGWLMKVRHYDTNAFWSAKRFETPEAGIAGYPTVDIVYVPPPNLQNFQTNAGGVSFEFLAEPEQAYTVQYKNSLANTNWLTLTNVATSPAPIVVPVFDGEALTNSSRFYRVIAPQ